MTKVNAAICAFAAIIDIAALVITFSKRFDVRFFYHASGRAVLCLNDAIITKHNCVAITNAVIRNMIGARLTNDIGGGLVMTVLA